MSNFTVFEGWDINQDEIVRRVDLVTQREFKNDIQKLLSLLKLKSSNLSQANSKGSGYRVDNVDFEVTAIHTYIPRTSKIEKALGEMSKIFGKCHHIYMLLDPDL